MSVISLESTTIPQNSILWLGCITDFPKFIRKPRFYNRKTNRPRNYRPRGARSIEVNFPFWNGCTWHRSLGSSDLLLVEILMISSDYKIELTNRIGAIAFFFSIFSIFSYTNLFFFSFIGTGGGKNLVSLLRGSWNLPHNSGLVGLWLLFASFLQKNWVSLLEV